MAFFSFCVSFTLLIAASVGYPYFREQIPNGNNVPHPCKPNYRWQGVGHENPNGGGVRNVFGLAFDAAGYQWTYALCRQDSDGDGKTNGEELGDPNCVWSPGQIPSRTQNISHPGICDPFDSPQCTGKNSFVSCEVEGFENCAAINNPDVMTLDLRFRLTQVPPTQTNYYCMTFDLPSDQDYHIVATEPIINNSNVLHHMLLYGCNDGDDLVIDPPASCGMSASKCGVIIGIWTVGFPGHCLGTNIGFRIGQTSFKRVRLEIHYNNPQLISTYTDSSGLRIYYQPAKPEVQDLFTFITGNYILEIPPGQSQVEETGVCPSDCTRTLFHKKTYIISGLNHMHYLGYSMHVELFRNGTKIADITDDDVYSYDSPINHIHNPPLEVLPGDEIKTSCVYNSMSTDRYTYYGEATSDEMCFAFMFMYPADAYTGGSFGCVSYAALSQCDVDRGTPVMGCDWATFLNDNVISTLRRNCNLDGFCRPECREIVDSLNDHPCLTGEMAQFMKWILQYMGGEGIEMLGRLQSCPAKQTPLDCSGQCSDMCWPDPSESAGQKIGAVSAILVSLVAMALKLMI